MLDAEPLTLLPPKLANNVSYTQKVGNSPHKPTRQLKSEVFDTQRDWSVTCHISKQGVHFIAYSMDTSLKSENSKQEKQHQSKQAYEESRRERLKTLPQEEQQIYEENQRKSQAKYRKSRRDALRQKEDLRRWRKFMNKYEDEPQKMPDDRVHRKGHLQHPEDY
ncbi:hypothetical protein EDD18DRAFT_1103544 [Armillaria luteobubalina]|uniref:Uncharacterized protein n=1 Tax=Armillaria luteobubalina TaxID=153913 RepID=A0AA39UQK2_9AGAR|nr:hypothetical protein EDD18DRAFT_1103544 [Armillaria luteobubalina]